MAAIDVKLLLQLKLSRNMQTHAAVIKQMCVSVMNHILATKRQRLWDRVTARRLLVQYADAVELLHTLVWNKMLVQGQTRSQDDAMVLFR